MRLTHQKHNELKAQALKLYNEGKTYGEIAEMIGVTAKTVGNWLTPQAQQRELLTDTKRKALKRLNDILSKPNPPMNEVRTLSGVLFGLKKLK